MKNAHASAPSTAPGRGKKTVSQPKVSAEVALIREAARDQWREEVMLGHHAPERHHITTEGRLKTAYWSWKHNAHCIAIGEDIREQIASVKPGASLPIYIGSFLRHELAHALFTERDLPAVEAACKKVGFTFRTLNLFEDARIEQAYRDAYGIPFKWLCHEEIPKSDEPAAAMFCLIQCEGDQQVDWLESGESMKARVVHYYQRCINARTTWEVIPVVADWIKEFPDQVDNPMASFQFPLDMELALEFLLGGHKPKGAFIVVNGIPASLEPIDERAIDGPRIHEASSGEADSDQSLPLTAEQMDQAVALAERLRREFKTRRGWESTANVTRRLHTRRLALDADRIYRERTLSAISKIKIAAVLDLSGSMSDEPSVAMRIMVTALSMLTARGFVEGTVTLSVNSVTETFCLPLSDKQIAKLEGYGSRENLATTFRRIEGILKDADLVMCITDGNITDGPVDVARLAQRGIKCLGVYVGTRGVNLSAWFAQYLARPSVQELIDEIGARIRPYIKGNR